MMPAGKLRMKRISQVVRFRSIKAQIKATIHPTRNSGVNSRSISQIAKKCEWFRWQAMIAGSMYSKAQIANQYGRILSRSLV
jgi:hypothetical protein